MDGVDPGDAFGFFYRVYVQVDDYGFVVAADQDAFQGFVRAGVDFLVGDVGGDEDEVAGAGFGDEFQFVAPAHSGAAA